MRGLRAAGKMGDPAIEDRQEIPNTRARIDKTLRALVIYASTHGHTAKVAVRIAEALRRECGEVDQLDVVKRADADPGSYDVVVAGGSLHLGKHQRELVDWAKANRDALADRPSAFFSVSLTAADGAEEAREATQSASVTSSRRQAGHRPGRCRSLVPSSTANTTSSRGR